MKVSMFIAAALIGTLPASGRLGSLCAQQGRPLGEFHLVALDGGTLPAPSPDRAGLSVHSLTLSLTSERFTLGSTFSGADGVVQSAPPIAGPYQVTDGELRFFPEQSPAGTTVVFGYEWQGARLVLTDANDHRWSMEKRPAV